MYHGPWRRGAAALSGGGGSGDGPSREDIVYEKADELLEKLPPDFIADDYIERIKRLGGLEVPLNIFLYQEVQRLQALQKQESIKGRQAGSQCSQGLQPTFRDVAEVTERLIEPYAMVTL